MFIRKNGGYVNKLFYLRAPPIPRLSALSMKTDAYYRCVHNQAADCSYDQLFERTYLHHER